MDHHSADGAGDRRRRRAGDIWRGTAQRQAELGQRLWGVYFEIIRNTPFVVQLFFIVFGLPSLGLKLTAGEAALLAMLINLGAYSTEDYPRRHSGDA